MAPTPVLLPGESQGRGAWWAAVHGVAKSRTRLSDFTSTLHFHALEKEMAPLNSKEIKPVNLKGNKPCWFGRTDAEAETPVFWSFAVNSWLIGKVPDAGKDWGQKAKRVSEDETDGWHHQCNRHEPGQTLGDGEGQRGLECCTPWGSEESDTTGWLNNNNA